MFKDRVKSLREMHNLTQEEFADKIAVSRAAVSKWETGKGYPSLDSLKIISNLFGVTIDELISDNDISNKQVLDKKKKNDYILGAVVLLLVVSLITGWLFFKKTEAMRCAADESMTYSFGGMSHKIKVTTDRLEAINQNGEIDKEEFAKICQDLNLDIFYSVESIAAFDYGVEEGYNDYDLSAFYSYIYDIVIISENYESMTEEAIETAYDSLYKVCVFFNDFDWNLDRTDNYIGTDLAAYNFRNDKQVRKHLTELISLTEKQENILEQYVKKL